MGLMTAHAAAAAAGAAARPHAAGGGADEAATPFAAALRRAGLRPGGHALYVAACEAVQRAGGDRRRARVALFDRLQREPALLAEAAALIVGIAADDMQGLPAGGHHAFAREGHAAHAPGRHADGEAGGQARAAREGHAGHAPVSPPPAGAADHEFGARKSQTGTVPAPAPDRGGGQDDFAENGQIANSAAATPQREPSPAERAAAVRAARRLARLTILDTLRVRDGRAIGDVRWDELPALASEDIRSGLLLRLIERHGKPTQPDARVRECINEQTLQRLHQKAAEISDAL